MKRLLAMTLMLVLVAACVPALAANPSPYTMDRRFTDNVKNMLPHVKWTRNVTSFYYPEGGWPVVITETARINGRDYVFTASGDENTVNSVTFRGWYRDMQMDEGMFPDGLTAYNCYLQTLYTILPDAYEADMIYSPYDFYSALNRGRPYETNIPGWHHIWEGEGVLEATHEASGDYMLALKEDDGSFTISAQVW